MRYANDDMDDLVRKAAKEYPLNTDTGQWAKIAGYLNNEDLSPSSGNRKNRRFFWLLLLIPVLYNQHTRNALPPGNRNARPVMLYNNVAAMEQVLAEEKQDASIFHKLLMANKDTDYKNEVVATKEAGTKNGYSAKLITGNMREYHRNDLLKKDKTDPSIKSAFAAAFFSHSLASVKTNFPEAIEFNLKTDAKQRQNLAIESSKPPRKNKTKRFYAGLIYGTAATTVKFQRVNDYGFDLGLVGGYDISKKWSIEAGMLTTQKKYYTDGKEFSTLRMYLPPNTRIKTVEGGCRMIELPVVARYHFSSNQKTTWFVSGGISSFLMKEEAYDYVYLYTNSGRTVKYRKTYKEASENWVSTAQFSGGFIYHVKNKFEIRAEPYVQVPLKGVGFGNLPLTNTGLRIGLSKKLF